MSKEEKIITVEVDYLHETEKAYCFDSGKVDKNKKPIGIWVPKSQCEYDEENDELQLPEWLAIKSGLV